MQSHIDPEELFRQIFGDFNRASRNRGGFGGFETIFEDFANFGFGNKAQEAVVYLSFKEAAKGANKEVDLIEAYGSTRLDTIAEILWLVHRLFETLFSHDVTFFGFHVCN